MVRDNTMRTVARQPIHTGRRRNRTVTIAVLVSLVVHALLLAVSTTIYTNRSSLGREAARLFKVKVREAPPVRPPVAPPPQPNASVIESIKDILRQEALIEPPTVPMPPDLSSKIADQQIREKERADFVPSEVTADVSPETAAAVDANVIAMVSDAFADNVGPHRRIVARGGTGAGGPSVNGPLPGWLSHRGAATESIETAQNAEIQAEKRTKIAEKQAEQATKEKAVQEEKPPSAGELTVNKKNLADLTPPLELMPVLEKPETVRKYESLDDLLDVKLHVYHRPDDPLGYFEVRIGAREKERMVVSPKDIVFVIDSSKSIGQAKLDKAITAVRQCLRELNPYDRFNVVAFKREPSFFEDTFVDATPDNISRAERFVRSLRSEGETDVYSALLPLVKQPARPNVPYILFLFSDGKSTVGDLGSRAIINQLTEANRAGANASIYAFAAGSSINRYLLDLLALRNRGTSEATRIISRIDEDMPAFYDHVRAPILIDITANFSGIEKDEIFPRQIPDLYIGRDITVLGRFGNEKEFSMRISGSVGGVRKEMVFRRNFADAETGDDAIATRWAVRKAYYVIEQMCTVGSRPELIRQLEFLNTHYGVRTAYDPNAN
ncbi:MAG: VWA domain-containing protein [Candidatus Hydrogenedentes bacterium]|nr:VWA domain-containing protein [Candidatus Hydrogenedentota bacterium]